MNFHPYQDAVSVEGTEDGYIVLGVCGAQSYREGEYINERNQSITVRVEPETAKEIIRDLETALSESE